MRFRLDIAYDGTDFHGWAAQPGQRTVQGVLQEAIGEALATLGLPPDQELTVAGRTDAGVHARRQMAHLDADVPSERCSDLERLIRRRLPPDIYLLKAQPAPPGFDARFSAFGRTYCYRLWDSMSVPFPALSRYVTAVPYPVIVQRMEQAAASLTGLRDFAPFCRKHDGATTIRHLRRFDVVRADDPSRTIECWLEADAFCQQMVRSLVGAVVAVGATRRDFDWLASVATGKTRANDVPVLPPGGLTLESVSYPPDDRLAARAAEARNTRSLEETP